MWTAYLSEAEYDDFHQAVAEGLAPQRLPAQIRVGGKQLRSIVQTIEILADDPRVVERCAVVKHQSRDLAEGIVVHDLDVGTVQRYYHPLCSDAIGNANLVCRYHHFAHERRARRPVEFHVKGALKMAPRPVYGEFGRSPLLGTAQCPLRSPRSRDQGSPVQQLASTDMENVGVNHHRHEMLENRVVCVMLSPQIAKSFSAHVACDRHCHVGRCWWAAHPLALELLYDVIEKGPGGLLIENVEAHDDRRKLASVIAKPFRVEIVDGVSMGHVSTSLCRQDFQWFGKVRLELDEDSGRPAEV